MPSSSPVLFERKKHLDLSFETIAKALGREEVAVAALFYGQAQASPQDIEKLYEVLKCGEDIKDSEGQVKLQQVKIDFLKDQLCGYPDRGRQMEMPPKEPLVYRLYEIIQNYGYAYKAVLVSRPYLILWMRALTNDLQNEKFGDGIMSAISFSTKIEKETDEKGDWAVITLRGKW